jgi:putative endonuclease
MGARGRRFFWIYMLRLANGSFYTGYAADLQERFQAHLSGRGAKITRSFAPIAVAACWKLYSSKGRAMAVEALIKGCPRRLKQELVERPEKLGELVQRRGWDERIEAVIPPPTPSY